MTSENRKNILLVTAAIVLGFAVIYGAWLLFIPRQITPRFAVEMARAAQETAAPMASTALDSSDVADESLARTLAMGLWDSAWSARERAQVVEGINTVVEFLAARSSGDPDDYVQWTRGQGLTPIADFPTKSPVARNVDWEQLYRLRTGEDPPRPLTPEVFFRASYAYESSIHDGAMRPIGVVTDPRGVEIDVAEITHFADNFDAFPPIHDDGLGIEFWSGGSSWGAVPFFKPERDLKAILESSNSTLAMRMRLIAVGPTGIRIPMWVTQYRDPRSGRWVIQDIHLSISPASIGLDQFVGMEY